MSSIKNKKEQQILNLYNNEIYKHSSIDLGVNGETRAQLRENVKKVLLDTTQNTAVKKANSHISGNSSSVHDYEGNAMSVLKKLQRERMIITRLGFTEKADKLDEQIEKMRKIALEQRHKEQEDLFNEHLVVLEKKQERKIDRLNAILASRKHKMEKKLQEEYKILIETREQEFINTFHNTEKKAIGKTSKCNCVNKYLCRHNESSSYNTRKPRPQVVLYKISSKRLKKGGRSEDAVELENMAIELDQQHQEEWRRRVTESVVASPWGANISKMDRMIENNKRQLKIMEEAHACKRKANEVLAQRSRWALQNNMSSEKNRLRNKCRKLYEKLLVERTKKENELDDNDELLHETPQILPTIEQCNDDDASSIYANSENDYDNISDSGNTSAINMLPLSQPERLDGYNSGTLIQDAINDVSTLKTRILNLPHTHPIQCPEKNIITGLKSIIKNSNDIDKPRRNISFSTEIKNYTPMPPNTSKSSSLNPVTHRKTVDLQEIKPGSVRDEDWIDQEKDMGNGYANSYGVIIE